MFETLDKMVMAGLGAVTMTREKAQEIFDEAVRRGQEKQANNEKFVHDVMDSAQRARMSLEELIARQVRQTMQSLNMPTRDDLARIEAKIDQLLNKPQP